MASRAEGSQRIKQNTLVVEDTVYQALVMLAEQEEQPVDDLASALLSGAIREHQETDRVQQRWQQLSRREQEIIALYCLGYTSNEIGKRLTLSLNTIKTHLRNGMQKLGLPSRSQLRRTLADWDFAGWLKVEPKSLPGYSQAYLPLPGFNNGRKQRI